MSKIQQNVIKYICTDTSTVSHIHTHECVCIVTCVRMNICVYKCLCMCMSMCVCMYRGKVNVSMLASQGSAWEVLLQEGLLWLLGRSLSMQRLPVVPPVFTGTIKCSDQNETYAAAPWGCVSTRCLAHLLSVQGKLKGFASVTREWQYSLEIKLGVWCKNAVLKRPFQARVGTLYTFHYIHQATWQPYKVREDT